MTISRVNGADFGIGDMLTSAQATQLDKNTTYALDKRSGQTDTLASTITCSGAGRIVPTVATGADANTTYQVNAANSVIRVTSAVTASRTYTLSATGAVTGDELTIYCEPSFSSSFEIVVKDQSSATIFVIGNADSADGQWARFIYIGGWRLFQQGQGSRTRIATFTADGTWTCPRGVSNGFIIAGGGGGGGGAGVAGPIAVSDTVTSGGGGGGGAVRVVRSVDLVAGEDYAVVIGAGGAPSTAGGDTTFTRVSGSVLLVSARGAEPGCNGGTAVAYVDFNGNASTPQYIVSPGGAPTRRGWAAAAAHHLPAAGSLNVYRELTPQAGGFGASNNVSSSSRVTTGNYSPDGYAGGLGGSTGSNAATVLRGGGAGGGGGAGAFGVGAVGGDGSSAVSGGDSAAGSNGASAAANTGGGGGGGGSSGAVASGHSSGAGGTGGSGGSGKLIILYVK